AGQGARPEAGDAAVPQRPGHAVDEHGREGREPAAAGARGGRQARDQAGGRRQGGGGGKRQELADQTPPARSASEGPRWRFGLVRKKLPGKGEVEDDPG